jgi:hypothetical protein
MFNSVALDVVIGLIFIYLLYSLLATVISEMIASVLGLRARNLKVAINRMLNDEKVQGLMKRFRIMILSIVFITIRKSNTLAALVYSLNHHQ